MPGYPRAELVLGIVLARRGDVRDALENLRKAAAKDEGFLKTQTATLRACLDGPTLKALAEAAARDGSAAERAVIEKMTALGQRA